MFSRSLEMVNKLLETVKHCPVKELNGTALKASACVVQPLTEKARNNVATWRMQLQRGVATDVDVSD